MAIKLKVIDVNELIIYLSVLCMNDSKIFMIKFL